MRNKLKILYEDKYIIVVDKPAKLLTIATTKEKEKTLYHQVYEYLKKKNQRVFIVHRLDKDTSGIVVFAKTEKIKRYLQNNWDAVIRKYIATVYGKIDIKGEIHNFLSETKTHITYISSQKKGKEAYTKYKRLTYNNKLDLSLVDIEILTGRKNQIRVHMNSINHPIVGDIKYGRQIKQKRMYLHAYYISFYHPIKRAVMEIRSLLPDMIIN